MGSPISIVNWFVCQVPEYVGDGVHKLVVEGIVNLDQNGVGQPIFRNETDLDFHSKYISIFVQTDNPLYYPEQIGMVSLAINPYLWIWG